MKKNLNRWKNHPILITLLLITVLGVITPIIFNHINGYLSLVVAIAAIYFYIKYLLNLLNN